MATGEPLGLYSFDGGCRWPLFELGQKLLEGLSSAFGHNLYRVVRAVAHVALQVETPSYLPGIEPIADPLNLAIDFCF
jgi:hypothetical protein